MLYLRHLTYHLFLLALPLAIFLLALPTRPALAQGPGDLDPSFDGDGIVTTSFDSGSAVAKAIAIQPDGKILVVGTIQYTPSNKDAVPLRYNADGSLDSTFDGDGKVISTNSMANALIL